MLLNLLLASLTVGAHAAWPDNATEECAALAGTAFTGGTVTSADYRSSNCSSFNTNALDYLRDADGDGSPVDDGGNRCCVLLACSPVDPTFACAPDVLPGFLNESAIPADTDGDLFDCDDSRCDLDPTAGTCPPDPAGCDGISACPVDDDEDGTCDAFDRCEGDDTTDDLDGDGVCDSDDVCDGDDTSGDFDTDGVCDDIDPCPLDNPDDSDGDGVCEGVDMCNGDDATGDADSDGVCDDIDLCDGDDVFGDADGDGVCSDIDPCPLDNPDDTDSDGVCDTDDLCDGNDASGDADSDGVCDDIDPCPLDNPDDTDSDGVCDTDDQCDGNDASGDADSDGVCDDIDPCPLDNPDDTDSDGVCDTVDQCAGNDASGDTDSDGVCDDIDPCPLDNPDDTDSDGVCDSVDQCTGNDASGDPDNDGVCSDIDPCPADNPDDTDSDGVCDSVDLCTGNDASGDPDGDGICSDTDPCPNDNPDDSDNDGSCDSTDLCLGDDSTGDVDADGLCADTEATLGTLDTDADSDDDGLDDRTEHLGLTPFDGGVVTTSPILADTDGDGILDGTEVGITAFGPGTAASFVPDADGGLTTTDPTDDDVDDDGLLDGSEDANANGQVDAGETDPTDDDFDDDGILDGTELGLTAPEGDDTDPGVFVADADPTTQTLPDDDDSDDDGVLDGNEDGNGNGRVDVADDETDPNNPDTDGDFLLDGLELGLVAPEGLDTDPGVFVADLDPTSTTLPFDADSDADGLDDGVEDANLDGLWDGIVGDAAGNCTLLGETDPELFDTDGDGLSDGEEALLGSCPLDTDSDDDGLTDGDEVNLHGSDPTNEDTDSDGIPDGDEVTGGTDPTSGDPDMDGLLDPDELLANTDPNDADSDDDGLLDGEEVNTAFTDPLNPDTDGDDILDGTELGVATSPGPDTDGAVFVPDADPTTTTDPNEADSDDDDLDDGVEDANHNGAQDAGETDPNDADSDDDGLTDAEESVAGPSLCSDTCDVFVCDLNGCQVAVLSSNGTCEDGGPGSVWHDLNADGTPDYCGAGNDCTDCGNRTTGTGTDPLLADSDSDGLLDGQELGRTSGHPTDTDPAVFVADADPTTTTDPNEADSDGDGLDDGVEDVDRNGRFDGNLDPTGILDETNPLSPDTDGDGLGDNDPQERIDLDGDLRLDALDICTGSDRDTSSPFPWVPGENDPDGDKLCNNLDPCNFAAINDGDGDNAYNCLTDDDGPHDFGVFGGCSDLIATCGSSCGLITCYGDCDDDELLIRPGLPDACDAGDATAQVDDDCDGSVYTRREWVDGDPANAITVDAVGVATYYPDVDGDGFGASGSAGVVSCPGQPNTSLTSDDCNDIKASINPQALELCNGIDENCNFQIDEVDFIDPELSGCVTLFLDADQDGIGGPATDDTTACACATGEGPSQTFTNASGQIYRRSSSDCDDLHAIIKPHGCNDGLDNDESGQLDANDPTCVKVSARRLTPSADAKTAFESIVLQGNTCVPEPADTDADTAADTDAANACPAWPTLQPETEGGACLDGDDNDGDGLTDLEDPDCELVNRGTDTAPIWALPKNEGPETDRAFVQFKREILDGHDNDCDGQISVLELDCDDDGAFPLLPIDLDPAAVDRRHGFVTAEDLGLPRCSGEARTLTCWDAELLTIVCDAEATGLWLTRYDASTDGFGNRFTGGFRNLTGSSECNPTADCDDHCPLRCVGQEETCDGVDNDCSGIAYTDVDNDGVPDALDPAEDVIGTVSTAELDLDEDQNANCEGEFRPAANQVQTSARGCLPYAEDFSTYDCDDLCYLASPSAEEACNGFVDVCGAPSSDREGTDLDGDERVTCGAYGPADKDLVEQIFVPVWVACDDEERDGCTGITPAAADAATAPFIPLLPPRARAITCDTALDTQLQALLARVGATLEADTTSADLVAAACTAASGGTCTVLKLQLDGAFDALDLPADAVAAVGLDAACATHPEELTLRTVWTHDRIVDARLGTVTLECDRIYGIPCDQITDDSPAIGRGIPPNIDDLLDDGHTWWIEVGRLLPDTSEGALMSCWGDPSLNLIAKGTGGDCDDAANGAHRDEPEGPHDLVLDYEGNSGDCSRCTDAIDNNCDGLIDCADPTCAACFVGQGTGCAGGRDACVLPDDTGGCTSTNKLPALVFLLLPMLLVRRRAA